MRNLTSGIFDRHRFALRGRFLNAAFTGWFLGAAACAPALGDGAPDATSEVIEQTQSRLRSSLKKTADWLDSFFGEERSLEEANFTNGRLSMTTNFVESETPSTGLDLRGKLVLPRLSKRVQLVFEGRPDEGDVIGLDNEQTSASLRLIAREKDRNRVIVDGGGRGGLADPSLFVRVLQRRTWEHGDHLTRFTPYVLYDLDDGLEISMRMDRDYLMPNKYFVRATTNPRWFENEPGYRLDQNFTVVRQLSDTRLMAFDWLNTLLTEPRFDLDTSQVQVRHRRAIWRDKLFLEFAPGLRFTAALDHQPQWTFALRLDLSLEP